MKIVQIVADQEGSLSYALDDTGQVWAYHVIWDSPRQYSTRKAIGAKWVRIAIEFESAQVPTESTDEGT